MNKEHLTPESMNALKNGLLSRNEAISALEHLGECEQCADALAESYGGYDLLPLSPGFRSAVFASLEKQRRTAVKGSSNGAGQKRELFRYGFKVSVAACITLILFFSGTMNYGTSFNRFIHTDLSEANVITENLRGFSDKLIHFEFNKYLKEE